MQPLSKGSVMERRGAARFRLRLAVVFSWRDEHGIVQGSEGWSRDLSSRGIYVGAEIAPPVGTTVEMNVFLPEPGYQIRAAELHAKGRVVRIDRRATAAESPGFAAMNHTVLLRESTERATNEKNSGERNSRVASQGIRAKQKAGRTSTISHLDK
jgi:hypothetical protein